MAIDTETKRRSLFGYSGPSLVLPVPDGTISAPDRAHILGLYSREAAESTVVSGPFCVGRTQVYVPGAQRTEVHIAGSRRTIAFVAGAQRTEACS